MLVLGVETSCDETAVSVVKGAKVLSNAVSSSVHLHAKYGGVIPEIASRFHTEYIYSVFEEALERAGKKEKEMALVAFTEAPGLPGSLLVGAAFARALGYALKVPVVGVDHVKAHAVSAFLDMENFGGLEKEFPFLSMVISGGHTNIYICRAMDDFELIGRTLDDAVGEAYDKVSKIMGLGYPGGPIIEQAASSYKRTDEIKFPRAFMGEEGGLDFSFSGIKTAVMYHWRDSDKSEEETKRVAFSFQEAVAETISRKIDRAIMKTGLNRMAFGGGVMNNDLIRKRIIDVCNRHAVEVLIPEKKYCGDNAAMVALLGGETFLSRRQTGMLDVGGMEFGCGV